MTSLGATWLLGSYYALPACAEDYFRQTPNETSWTDGPAGRNAVPNEVTRLRRYNEVHSLRESTQEYSQIFENRLAFRSLRGLVENKIGRGQLVAAFHQNAAASSTAASAGAACEIEWAETRTFVCMIDLSVIEFGNSHSSSS